jgi:hypothetical protein
MMKKKRKAWKKHYKVAKKTHPNTGNAENAWAWNSFSHHRKAWKGC